jgi:hypothetical protein
MAYERVEGGGAARIVRTGLALVHEGELVLPAAGSEAQAEQVVEDSLSTIVFTFPVEIEVRRVEEPVDADAIADRVIRILAQKFESR